MYPYIIKRNVWGNSFDFIIDNFQGEDWYAKNDYVRWNEGLQYSVNIGDTVIDCGAHHGFISLSLSKRVGRTGKIFAFEPSIRNFGVLERNIELNDANNIIAKRNVVGDVNGKTVSLQHERVFEIGEPVTTITIDSLDIEPDFIKIDVEAYEVKVIKGAKSTLEKIRPRLEIELHLNNNIHVSDYGDDPNEMLKILIFNEYTILYEHKIITCLPFFKQEAEYFGVLRAFPSECWDRYIGLPGLNVLGG